ncbi:response regulator [Pedobacter sp. HMF7647]|uniref:Response regulator n=1 Tax=Hufsiella arboris TaxID=2695275 RepID=A0A7K1YAB6_9SPHI|nr:LytTR family DNA-binding domain-containing protein [Hufsiella arboris]MXV51018.1 response regulator [Hufsiella arboris]
MQKLKSLAIDDEPLALSLIKTYVDRFPALQLCGTFEDAISAAEFLKYSQVDLLFIDINMPDISGIDLVRSLSVKPMIIFTTAYKNFAYEGFELEAIDYLLKPIDFDRFSKAASKAIEYHHYRSTSNQNNGESIFVYSEYRLVRIPVDEILWIESLEDYITIHLQNDESVTTLMSLKKILEKLPEANFKRIHRSYIIPVKSIASISNKKVKLRFGKELPIGDSYTQNVQELLKSS